MRSVLRPLLWLTLLHFCLSLKFYPALLTADSGLDSKAVRVALVLLSPLCRSPMVSGWLSHVLQGLPRVIATALFLGLNSLTWGAAGVVIAKAFQYARTNLLGGEHPTATTIATSMALLGLSFPLGVWFAWWTLMPAPVNGYLSTHAFVGCLPLLTPLLLILAPLLLVLSFAYYQGLKKSARRESGNVVRAFTLASLSWLGVVCVTSTLLTALVTYSASVM